MERTERRLEDLSALKYRIYTCPFRQPTLQGMVVRDAVIVAFTGNYGSSSVGNADACFMTGIARAALEAWGYRALVLDLREMTYEWGDELNSVLEAGTNRYDRPLPTALLVSDINREALTGLLRYLGKSPSQWAFDTLEEAIPALERQAEEQDAAYRKTFSSQSKKAKGKAGSGKRKNWFRVLVARLLWKRPKS